MAAYTAPAAAQNRPASTVTGAGQVDINHGVFSLSANLAASDTIRLCRLPAGHVPVDFILDSDDVDSGGSPTIAFNVGIEDTIGATTNLTAFLAATNVGQAGGLARITTAASRRIAPVDYDRYVTLTVSTGPATGVATGKITGTLFSRVKGRDD
jgi:hypothetical protein